MVGSSTTLPLENAVHQCQSIGLDLDVDVQLVN